MDLLCFSVLCLLCLCEHLFICALWSPAGKSWPLGGRLWCISLSLSLSHWYPGSGVVLDLSIPEIYGFGVVCLSFHPQPQLGNQWMEFHQTYTEYIH